MVDSKENYKFDLGVKGLNVPQTPFEFHSQVLIVESPFLDCQTISFIVFVRI